VVDNNSQGEDNNARGGDKAAAEHDHIALAIDTLRKGYEGVHSDRSKHDQKSLFWARWRRCFYLHATDARHRRRGDLFSESNQSERRC
jgi:hypothetical protein